MEKHLKANVGRTDQEQKNRTSFSCTYGDRGVCMRALERFSSVIYDAPAALEDNLIDYFRWVHVFSRTSVSSYYGGP